MQSTVNHQEFQTTSWTLVHALQSQVEAHRAQAAQELTKRYWPAVYAALRRRGLSQDKAEETTQGFFVDVVIGRDLLSQGDQSRGKLRSLILTSLMRYSIDCHRRTRARGGELTLSAENIAQEEKFVAENECTNIERLFDRRWAVATLDQAVQQCAQYCLQHNLARHWKAFEMQVLLPAKNGGETPSLETIANALDFDSTQQVASATKVVRKHLRLKLQEAVGETVADPERQHQEYQYLLELLS